MATVLPISTLPPPAGWAPAPPADPSPPTPVPLLGGPYILSIPIELVEHVLLCASSPSDLLSLALTCKALYDLIVPDYLHWHSVSLPADHTAAFALLHRNHRVARLVHNLIITDSEATAQPGFFLRATISEAGDGFGAHQRERDWGAINGAAANLASLRSLVLHVKHVAEYKTFVGIVQRRSPYFAELCPQQYLGYYYFSRVSSGPAIDVRCSGLPALTLL